MDQAHNYKCANELFKFEENMGKTPVNFTFLDPQCNFKATKRLTHKFDRHSIHVLELPNHGPIIFNSCQQK